MDLLSPKPIVLLRIDRVHRGRMTLHRLVCSECGDLDPPMRSKIACQEEARQHAKQHPAVSVQLV